MDQVLYVAQEGLVLVLFLSAPPVVASLLAGLATSIFQTSTQLQDTSIAAAPRLVAVYGSLIVASPWIGGQLLRFTEVVFATISAVG